MIQKIKIILSRYSKVFENYFFMTFLQGANMLIGLFLYPYLIRVLGQSNYGTYVFVFSNISFFISFISFGFTYPALKKVSLQPENADVKNETVSGVFTAKFYLFLVSVLILSCLIAFVPFVKTNAWLYIIIFSTVLNEVLFPVWYFQAVQKMKYVTFVQLSIKLLSIPLILIFVKSPDNLLLYASIMSGLTVLGAVFSVFYLRVKEGVVTRFVSLKSLRTLFSDSLPFFWTSAFGTVKREMVTLIIGTFFNMRDVAIYDLANKIVMIPRLITNNINSAIFPSMIGDIQAGKIKKIIRHESIIALATILLIVVFGYWAVLLLGGKGMLAAYPMAIALSITIYTYLVVGCYINYVFVPQNRYYFVTKNQFVALVSFLVLTLFGVFVCKNILLIALAYSLSGIIEIFYCKYVINKYKLYEF
nr:oligosaccharide flippase family protein [Paludibacter sp. 221]